MTVRDIDYNFITKYFLIICDMPKYQKITGPVLDWCLYL